MSSRTIVAALLLAAGATSASAQAVSDDVRCLVLSNLFAKAAKEEPARRLATVSASFYLGRLDGRTDPRTLAAAIRAQPAQVDPKTAGPMMNACAARVARAEQSMQSLARSLTPRK